ncbi:transposase, partial [Neisseriaceae bacterium TC5R-5]|nr:transposase [Neisseriaceae bacterium TC5R-5]
MPLSYQAAVRRICATKPIVADFHQGRVEIGCCCRWRMLPSDFPKWRTVYSYFEKWSAPDQDGVSVLEQALKNQVGVARAKQARDALTSFLIVDAQSVKNTDTATHKGYDAGKKVSGIKRHIAVDT